MRTLGSILDNVIKESLGRLTETSHELDDIGISEKDEQEKTVKSLKPHQSSKNKERDSEDEEKVSSSKSVEGDTDDMKSTPKVSDVVEKLNTVRSGRSLKDEDVLKRFTDYFESLTDAEKTAMFVYLKGIGQILTGDLPAQQAADPGDDPANIKTTKKDVSNTKSLKPNVVSEPDSPLVKKTASKEEDTAPPVPIKPVKK